MAGAGIADDVTGLVPSKSQSSHSRSARHSGWSTVTRKYACCISTRSRMRPPAEAGFFTRY